MASERQLRDILHSDELLELLAAAEHERWARWQQYLHDQCEVRIDGALVIPAELAIRWATQIATPYERLSEDERESDREQVRRYLPIIARALAR